MKTSREWIDYFKRNQLASRINWSLSPQINNAEKRAVLQSLQAWQLGETSDGAHLLAAAKKYSLAIGDEYYCRSVQLFIKEEQKHGNNLGRYLDLIGEKRVSKDWGDTLFRKIRYYNTNMECWTLAVIAVESTAQVFYQSLKDATGCPLLKQICTDILIDEAPHIQFQLQRMQIIFAGKTVLQKIACYQVYKLFYFATSLVVWLAHHKAFSAGGNNLGRYLMKMNYKFKKTLGKLFPVTKGHTEQQQINHLHHSA